MLKFCENVHPSPCVTYQVSGVSCQVSGVKIYIFFDKELELVGGGSVINRNYFVYFFTGRGVGQAGPKQTSPAETALTGTGLI